MTRNPFRRTRVPKAIPPVDTRSADARTINALMEVVTVLAGIRQGEASPYRAVTLEELQHYLTQLQNSIVTFDGFTWPPNTDQTIAVGFNFTDHLRQAGRDVVTANNYRQKFLLMGA